MKISLFTQSLFDLSLEDSIEAAAETGFDGIEIACSVPHLALPEAREKKDDIVKLIQSRRLEVSALSTYTNFTRPDTILNNVELLSEFTVLSKGYGTSLIRITPGPPSSRDAKSSDFENWKKAMSKCVSMAKRTDVRLAVETHLGMMSDRTESVKRLIEDFDQTLGVTLDFCNVYLGGDDPTASIKELRDKIYFCHVKNVRKGKWVPLDKGELNYSKIVHALGEVGYDGYLSIECLYDAPLKEKMKMIEADYRSLKRILRRDEILSVNRIWE